MVEVLVAVVILAFGMLGTVGMQAFALQSNRDARQQAQAVALAYELADMMRGNPFVAFFVTSDVSQNPYMVGEWRSETGMRTPKYCQSVTTAVRCQNPLDVAKAEMTDWLTRVNAELPGVRVNICFDSTPYVTATGLPQWDCTGITGTTDIVAIKIGWTRTSTNATNTTPERADATSSRPQVVLPVSAQNAT